MKAALGRMCRGDGFAYVCAEVSGLSEGSRLEVSACDESGAWLPVNAYRAEGASGSGVCRSVVLATPLLETKSIVFSFAEYDDAGTLGPAVKASISRESLKWQSRLNYRLHSSEMDGIRDIDKIARADQIELKPLLASEFDGEVVLKGLLSAPYNDGRPDFVLIDSLAREVVSPSLVFGAMRLATVGGVARWEMGFTLRVPRDFQGCFVARSLAGNKAGMLPFGPSNTGILLSRYDSRLFYTTARPECYPNYLKKQRAEERFSIDAAAEGLMGGCRLVESIRFSIIVPLFRTPLPYFREMVASVFDQTYSNWELVLVNASPEDESLSSEVASLADERVVVVPLEKNLGIAENTNAGIEVATGDYIALFDHDDLLEPTVLAEYASAISGNEGVDALYCDEDLYNENGEYVLPHFKSAFNIDLLRCHNYITHFLCVRAEMAKRLRERAEYDGAQDYDFILRVAEESRSIVHVDKVLYHWRMHSNSTAANPESKRYADEAGRKALQDHLDRCGLKGEAACTESPFVYHVEYEVLGNPLISIVIPNKDNADVLERCIASIFEKTDYLNYEIVIVENNSTSSEVFELYRRLEQDPRVRVVVWEREFNYSAINNFGVSFTEGEYVLLLNNDTEVISSAWMKSMLSYCQREDVGIVGARLLYPDDTVQHAGVVMGKCFSADETGGPNHVFMHLDKREGAYMDRSVRTQDLSAVTAACLMVSRDVFERLGGLDESFRVAYNDVDFCLRVRDLGLLVVYVPDAQLYHYESLSRGADDESSGVENYSRFLSEQGLLRSRWSSYYAQGDPYHGRFATMNGWEME